MSSERNDVILQDVIYHCQTQIELSTFSCTWSITNFLEISKFVSEFYSDEMEGNFRLFLSHDRNNVTYYFLASKNKQNEEKITNNVSIFLNTTEGEINMNIPHPITLFNKKCEKKLLLELSFSFLNSNKEKYLPNETLTIRFTFQIFNNNLINSSICHKSYKPEIFVTDMKSFVPNENSDLLVTFVINKERLQANKILLCLKSKVFEAMFNSGLKEDANNIVEITDIKYDILKQLLDFLQTGYLPKNIKTNAEVACELLIAAEKYDIEDLKSSCEQNLIKNTTMENVVKHLQIAHLHNATELKKYAKDFIKLYLKYFVDTPNFVALMQKYPELLIEIENINLSITKSSYRGFHLKVDSERKDLETRYYLERNSLI